MLTTIAAVYFVLWVVGILWLIVLGFFHKGLRDVFMAPFRKPYEAELLWDIMKLAFILPIALPWLFMYLALMQAGRGIARRLLALRSE